MAFNGAHDLIIGTSNISVYQQNHPAPSFVDPAKILHEAQAVEALHTSATVGYISKCHPGTREEVTTDLVKWVVGAAGADQGSSPRKLVLWFSGPAGAGKTSIMRGVVDRCGATGFSTLSFFFSVRGSGVTTVRPFVATLIHQLAALNPVLRPIIYDAIRDRPTIFEESLEAQIERVLVAPLQSPAFQSQSTPPNIVIAIDGLDECREEREREQLLDILHSLITKLPRLIVFVIASRPEFDLRRAFARPKLDNITESIKLHNYDGSDDVRVLVCDELEEIRQSHPLAGSIPEGWPLEGIVQQFVNKCSGNFIVPVTAMKYIKTSRRNPVDSLNIILGVLKNPSPTSKPFAELDALYALILNPPEADPSLIKRILHCIIGVTAIGRAASFLSSSFLDYFLKLPPGTTATTLCDLHSILHIPESKYNEIKFHHKSMEDYLLDPERSSDFFQSPYKTQLDLTMLCATHLTHWGSNPVVDTSLYIDYSAYYWGHHLKSCINQKPVSATLPDVIMDLDPRNAMMWRFTHGGSVFAISNDLAKALHAALCSEQHCVRLCQLVTRVNNCRDECYEFRMTLYDEDKEGRLNALSRFKSETGLFAPLDPDSRVVFYNDENGDVCSRLVEGDEDSRMVNRDEHGQLEDEIKDYQTDTTGGSAIASREGHPSNPPSRRDSLDVAANFNNEEKHAKGDEGEEGGKGSEEEEGGDSVDDLMGNTRNGQRNPPSRRELLDAEANFDNEEGVRGNEEEEGGEGGQSGDDLMANTMDGRNSSQSKWESLDGANPTTVPPPNDPPPPAVFDDEDEEFQPKASPSTLPPPPDNNLGADTTGGPAGGSGGSAMVGHDGLGRPSNLPHRRELLGFEASPSTFPTLAPSPSPNLVVGPWHRFTAWIRRLFRRTRS